MENQNNKVETGLFGKPKLKKTSREDKIFRVIVAVAILITIALFVLMEYKWEMVDLGLLWEAVQGYLRIDLVPTNRKIEMALSLINTLALAFLATLFGFLIGAIFSVFAARNIAPKWLATIVSGISGVMRAIPTIVWVLIFVAGYGLSATTAVVGMFFHTFSFFVKSLSESYEEVSDETIEALMASGATKAQVIFGAIIPSALTRIIAWIGLRLEQNFGTAVVIGPAVGVPGTIGTDINNASRTAEFPTVGFGILLIIITALILEFLSNQARKRNMFD